MKHEKHPWFIGFIRDSNPVPLGQKSGATRAPKEDPYKFQNSDRTLSTISGYRVLNKPILNFEIQNSE
jgi:hypothetical protein